MKIFTEKRLIELGFQREDVPKEDNDGINPYRYYTLNFEDENYTLCLISGCFEKDIKEVTVEFFEGEKCLSEEFIMALKKEFEI